MPKIHHRERADGVHQRLQSFMDWWEAGGPFDVVVPENGGVRFDASEQLKLYLAGVTAAKSLADTPHGRGCAVDLAPLINGKVPWDDWAKFAQIGAAAEAQGLEWGGRWRPDKLHPKRRPDGPHIQLPNWRLIPFKTVRDA